jgi:hypothetical protein
VTTQATLRSQRTKAKAVYHVRELPITYKDTRLLRVGSAAWFGAVQAWVSLLAFPSACSLSGGSFRGQGSTAPRLQCS